MAFIPYSPALCSGSTSTSGLSKDPDTDETEITLGAGTSIVSGEVYAIVAYCPTATYVDVDTNNAVTWAQDTNAGYAGGEKVISDNEGVNKSWTVSASRDCYFKTKAGAVVKESFTTANALQFIYHPYYIAQTFTATDSYTITSVVLSLGRSSQASDPGTLYVEIWNAVDSAAKVANPSPTNAATSQSVKLGSLSWDSATGADSYTVYHGFTSGSLTEVSTEQAGTSFTLSNSLSGYPYNYITTVYWRVDSVNVAEIVTTGDEWSFTTLRFLPPGPTYWYSAGEYWYQLLVQADGTYGDPPPTGVEDTDYVVVSFDANFIRTARKLVAAANNTIWYEDI